MSDETKTGYVQAKARNKANTQWRLQLNGTWYGVDRSANVDGVEQGVYVEYQLGGFKNSQNGQWVPTVARIRPAQAPSGAQQAQSYNAALAGSAAPSRLASAHWDDSALRFISNVVGCAIESGKCAQAEDLLVWATMAEIALKNMGQAQASGPGSGSASKDEPEGDPGFDDSDDLNKMPPW